MRIKSATPRSRIATVACFCAGKKYGFHWIIFVAYTLPQNTTAMNKSLLWLLTVFLLAAVHSAEAQQECLECPTSLARG
jgi:hypothetical protein